MELYLIRHGQSTNNARWETLDGRSTVPVSDPTLTEKGVRQAELLAEFLAFPKENEEDFWRDPQNRHGFGLTHVYCSLMKRAIHTHPNPNCLALIFNVNVTRAEFVSLINQVIKNLI